MAIASCVYDLVDGDTNCGSLMRVREYWTQIHSQ